jgi:hypothetical protein
MATAKQNLATKLTQLQITRDKTQDIGSSGIKIRIERQKNRLQTLGNAAEKAITTLEEIKIPGGGGGRKLRILQHGVKRGESDCSCRRGHCLFVKLFR